MKLVFSLRHFPRRVFSLALVALAAACFPTLGAAAAGGTPALPDRNPAYTAIHVIGDSLSDTGRMATVLSLPGMPFPPPPYAMGRISNGPVWIEYFAPQLRRSYDPLTNFSWAGAETGHQNSLGAGLPGMLDELGEILAVSSGKLDPNALYVVFGGSNDFFRIFKGENPASVIANGVNNIVTIVATLRAAGARKLVVIDLPDIGRTPRANTGPGANPAAATMLSAQFNSSLNAALDAMNFPIVRVSTFELINQFVSQPHKFGFTNVTGQGILNLAQADTYVFWDDVHPTTRSHRYVADEVFHALARAGWLGQNAK